MVLKHVPGSQYNRLRRLRPPTEVRNRGCVDFFCPSCQIPPCRLVLEVERRHSKGDDTTEQILYSRQEAEELVGRWADTVLRVGYTWTGNLQDAQDVSQTVLLKLLTSPRRFDTEERERAWVLRVAVNCCKDLRKSAWFRRRAPLESAGEAAVELPELEDSPVLRAVQALPEKYRQAVYLRYYEEYEVEEIAALMGCGAPQVSTYLYRGRQKLKTMLGGIYGQQCLSE